MDIVVQIPEHLAILLTAAGADPERLALEALRQAADEIERGQQAAASGTHRRTPAEAAARMRASRVGNILPEGVTIRDLMTYGRA